MNCGGAADSAAFVSTSVWSGYVLIFWCISFNHASVATTTNHSIVWIFSLPLCVCVCVSVFLHLYWIALFVSSYQFTSYRIFYSLFFNSIRFNWNFRSISMYWQCISLIFFIFYSFTVDTTAATAAATASLSTDISHVFVVAFKRTHDCVRCAWVSRSFFSFLSSYQSWNTKKKK